jgi:formate-dependent phosphoribosylglycinamide formyltransferase (GAR transformylase)
MSFINRVKVDIQHVGFPCVLKLAITELGFGQSIIQGDDEGEIYNALRFAIKQSHEHGINPGDRIILEKEISQPFSEVVQIAVQHHDPITGPRITFAPPILVKHISKGNLASDDRTQAITGPFVLDFSIQCDIRQMPSLVQTNHSQMQALTAKMINSLGTSPGIYGVTFFITDTGLWIPDDIPVKAEDTMFVTNTAQLFSAAELLTMCLTDKPVQASAIQELQYAGGTRTILWRENRLAELESIEGQAEARAISGIHSIEIYNSKIDLRPLRLMGIINARLPKDASLLDIVNCLDEALSKVRIVPHM